MLPKSPHAPVPQETSAEAATAEDTHSVRRLLADFPLRAVDVLERMADAFVALDHQWHILYANREACRINQKPLEEFQGKLHWEEWPGALGTELEHQFRRVMSEKTEAHFEHRYVFDAYDVWLELDVYPARDGISLFYRDISKRKQAEEALRSSEARYRSLIDATAQIVWTNTPEGEMNGANVAWGAFTGQSEAEYQGYGWAKAVHEEDAQPTIDAWREAVAARKPFLFEHRLRRHDGVYRTFAIHAVSVPADDGSIREWVGIHTDVTEQRAVEATRHTLLAQQRLFLRDVLASVTEGRLLLSNSPAQLPALLTPVGEPIVLTREGGLRDLRLRAEEAGRIADHFEERQFDLLTAVSEAGMNAITHAGSGVGQVTVGDNGTVQVRIEDHGAGIAVEDLPQATLARGFSTKATLGHGLKMMLQTADRLYLLTGTTGTTVVLEQDRVPPPPPWL